MTAATAFDYEKAREHAEWTKTLAAHDMDGISAVNINRNYLRALDEIARLRALVEDER